MLFRMLLLFGVLPVVVPVWSLSSSSSSSSSPSPSRRQVLAVAARTAFLPSSAAAVVAVVVSSHAAAAQAFDNRVSTKYDDRPKQRGGIPRDLGVGRRRKVMTGGRGDDDDDDDEYYIGLKPCGAAPNCFCSTDSVEDDPEHSIPAWKWPQSSTITNVKDAFVQLEATIQAYKPGQDNIDGGGFKIIKSQPGYIYVQFESLKNGFVDDVEFATVVDGNNNNNNDDDGDDGRMIQVRSSSRLGYLDYGVNAKRLNYIARALRQQGWDAPGVDYKTHPGYVVENRIEL